VSAGHPPAPVARSPLRDALRWWEPRRLWYNAALTAQAALWVVLSWPHFRPALTLPSLGKLLVLALLANLCYSAAYLVDLAFQEAEAGDAWRRRRGMLWVAGTLFALLFECYWIADEIYPYVTTG
jgi:hypothetical protein